MIKIMLFIRHCIYILSYSIRCGKKSYILGKFKKDKCIEFKVGNNSKIHNLEMTGYGKVVVDNNVEIRDLYIHIGSGASVRIRDGVFIGKGVKFLIYNKLDIGNDTLISPDVIVVDNDHVRSDLKFKDSGLVSLPISIGDNCWIGAKSTICKGVFICSNSVVGAMSLVNSNVDVPSLYAGIPAVLKKKFNDE